MIQPIAVAWGNGSRDEIAKAPADPVDILRAQIETLGAQLTDIDRSVAEASGRLDFLRSQRDDLRSLLRKTERAYNAMTVTRTRKRKESCA